MKTRIIILAKEPKPGLAKTRLIPTLGESGSAKLANKLLHHALEQALASLWDTVELYYAPHDWQVESTLGIHSKLRWYRQCDGDLGARLSHACAHHDAQFSKTVVMGTDCPGLLAAVLNDVLVALDSSDAAIIPATDGGYVALAYKDYRPEIFQKIEWSTASVFESTVERFNSLSWSWDSLTALPDIDLGEDLATLPQAWQKWLLDECGYTVQH